MASVWEILLEILRIDLLKSLEMVFLIFLTFSAIFTKALGSLGGKGSGMWSKLWLDPI